MEIIALFIACLLIMSASFAGVFFSSRKLTHWSTENLNYLVAFAAGVFLIVTHNLIFEAYAFNANALFITIFVAAGFIFFMIVEKLYPELHCHHDDNHCQTEKNKRSARKVLLGDALHNIGDGILLAPVFFIDVKLGVIAALGIFVHEFVQEVSEFFVLRAAGYTVREALVRNFLVAATILAGAVAGTYLAGVDHFIAPILAFAAGAFLHILVVDLLPQSIKESHKEKTYARYILWTLAGIVVILAINHYSQIVLSDTGLDGHGHLELHHDDDHDHDE